MLLTIHQLSTAALATLAAAVLITFLLPVLIKQAKCKLI